MDPPCQFHPPRARRGPARAHSRTSPGFSATTPAHAPNSLFRAPPVPRTHPHLISHTLALSRALPSLPDAPGDLRPRSRPSSSPETAPSLLELRPEVRHLSPCPIFPIALYARPRRTVVLAWWLADLSRSSSPALVPKVPLPLLKLAQALARLKPPPRGRNASLKLLRPARDLLSADLLSLPSDSWPLPRH